VAFSPASACKYTTFFGISAIIGEKLRYMLWEYSQTTKLLTIMNKNLLFGLLAAGLLTACEPATGTGTWQEFGDSQFQIPCLNTEGLGASRHYRI
jgi:hypothetical protein